MPVKYDHFYSYSQVYQQKSHQQLTEKIGVSNVGNLRCPRQQLHRPRYGSRAVVVFPTKSLTVD